MTIPVQSLEEFFPTYLTLLKVGDADSLGALYTEDAVLTSSGGPGGDEWAVGRDQIVATLRTSLQMYTVDSETPPPRPYEVRNGTLAARFGTFRSTMTPTAGGPSITLTVHAIEVLALSPTEGWQYVADQSHVLSITKSQISRT